MLVKRIHNTTGISVLKPYKVGSITADCSTVGCKGEVATSLAISYLLLGRRESVSVVEAAKTTLVTVTSRTTGGCPKIQGRATPVTVMSPVVAMSSSHHMVSHALVSSSSSQG